MNTEIKNEGIKKTPRSMENVMGLKNQIDEIKNIQKEMAQQIQESTGNNGFPQYLKDFVADRTEEEINMMTREQLLSVYNDNEEGMDIDADADKPFLVDFLMYIKESEEQMKKFDDLVATYETEMTELVDEIKAECEKFGDVRGYVKDGYITKLETAEGEEKVRLERAIIAIDDSLELNRLVDLYKTFKPENTVGDFCDASRRAKVLKDYAEAVKKMNIRTDLAIFKGIERKFLNEKYHAFPSLFLFVVMKYVGQTKNTCDRSEQGLFIVSLAMTLQGLFTDTLLEENKTLLLSNIERVLDLFYVK